MKPEKKIIWVPVEIILATKDGCNSNNAQGLPIGEIASLATLDGRLNVR
ncbi:MAG: hypothetical protein AABM67_17245 [Acidobacteriota bacterium]